MAEIIQIPIRSVYKDGSIVISNVKSKIDNTTTSYTVVNIWHDGTPMDDSKVDQFGIYSKYKPTGEYLRENKPQWGELFLEVDTVESFRAMSPYNQHLLFIGYFKGVTLNGYENKGDTPRPISYRLSSTVIDDDGGSVIIVGLLKFEHFFNNRVEVAYFGAKGDNIKNDLYSLLKAEAYCYRNVSANPTLYFNENVGYNINDTLTIRSGISVVMKSPIYYNGAKDRTALVIGQTSAINVKVNFDISVTAISNQSNWDDDKQYVGVKFINAYECFISLKQSSYFTLPFLLVGDGRGCVYNDIKIGECAHGRHQIGLFSRNGGWCNSNRFYGGRLWVATNIGKNGKSRYGVILWSEDGYRQNNNVFYSTSFELGDENAKDGNPDGEAFCVVIENGRQNRFESIRDEGNTKTARTLNDSFGNYIHANFSRVFAKYDNSIEDNGLFPSTTFETDIQSPNQELGWLLINIPSLRNEVYRYNATNIAAFGSLILQNVGSPGPTTSVTGIGLESDYISVNNQVGIGIRIDTRKRKRFNISLDYLSENAGRLYIICRDVSGNIISDLGTVRISPRQGEDLSSIGNPYRIGQTTFFGGSFALTTGSNPSRDLGNIMQYIVVSTAVHEISILFSGYNGNALLKGFSVYSLDGQTSVKPYRQLNQKISSESPSETSFNGDFHFNVSNTSFGWKCFGGTWLEVPLEITGVWTIGLGPEIISAAASYSKIGKQVNLSGQLTFASSYDIGTNTPITLPFAPSYGGIYTIGDLVLTLENNSTTALVKSLGSEFPQPFQLNFKTV